MFPRRRRGSNVSTFSAGTAADWRAWLAQNCWSEKEVWLVIYHSGSGTPSVRYHEAIEHALWYGWIDSQARPDAGSSAIPGDLRELLDDNEAARKNFQNFPPSSKRLILEWVATAKRLDTRRRRINQTVNLAAVNIRANHAPGRAAVSR